MHRHLRWSKDGRHLLFFFSAERADNDEESHSYYIPTDDLADDKGRTRWFEHLSEKIWFTDEVQKQFRTLSEGQHPTIQP